MSEVGLQPVDEMLPAQPTPLPQPHADPGSASRKQSEGWLASIQSLATTVVIAIFVITFLVQAFQIPSESMEQTLLIGDYLLVDKVHFGNGGHWGEVLPYSDIHRGDIIVFRYPVHPDQHFVKRVVAVPGDRIRLINKRVYVNGQQVQESYAVHGSVEQDIYRDEFPQLDLPSPSLNSHWWVEMRQLVSGGELLVPPGRYFVLGDNRDFSLDSRYWGFVPRENIIGRPLVIYLSLRSASNAPGAAADDKLSPFGLLSQLVHLPRWRRTFRVVN
jgi:signal peptidase I